ncbi:MAG: DUF6318 family protein [Pseudonocardiales bacterium]
MIRRLALVWACCALAVAGCSKPDKPGTLPPLPSASKSASASPTAGAPTDPKAVVVALAREYYLERNHAIETGDTARLRSLSTPDCECLKTVANIESQWQKGRIEAPNYYALTTVSLGFFRSSTIAFVSVHYALNQEAVFDTTGRRVEFYRAEPQPHSTSVECHLVSGTWKVADIVRL